MYAQVPPRGSLAICMGRYSSDMQNPRSADDQIRVGMEICERQGWKVVTAEKDEAKTGRTMVGRTGLYNVLAAAEAGDCDVVVVEDISRIARNARDMMDIAERLREANVVIYTFGGGVVGGMELAIRAQMAQEQSEETARRVKRGHRSAAAKGRVIGGIAYGYRRLEKPDEFGELRAIEEQKAKVVLRIYKDLLAGVSSHAICAQLNREGVPAPSGKLWRPRVLTGDKAMMTGIGRNPLYVGKLVYNKSNSKLVTSTGKVKVKAAPSSEYVMADVEHLRIVPDEMWHAVQEILDGRSRTVPNNARQPTYLFSKLIKCGCCGHSFAAIGGGLGCAGRRYHNGCTNRRRVPREDLEEAVLTGLSDKILAPHILQTYLAEYRQEFARASEEYGSRAEVTTKRLQEVEREVDNLMTQIKGGVGGFAAQRINEELEQLGAQKKQLERDLRRRLPESSLSMETDATVERLKELLGGLSRALQGPERDAARARDIIRSFITEIRVTPLEGDGKADGRGAGPVRVTVDGSLTELLGLATTDRALQRRGTNVATLGLPIVVFSYYVDISRENPSLAGGVADVARLSQALDDAYAPVRQIEIIQALNGGLLPTTLEESHALEQRERRAVSYLKNAKLIRSVRLADGAGWVWEDCLLSNDEWRLRAAVPNMPPEPIAVIRMSPPEAFVVTIGPS